MLRKFIGAEEYLDTDGVLAELDISKKLFYASVKPNLQVTSLGGKKKPWYRRNDVLALKAGRPARKDAIQITGMYGNWSSFAQSEHHGETDLRSVDVTMLPGDAVERFRLSAQQQFVKRSRLTRVDGNVICAWDTYYPLDLVQDAVDSMKQGVTDDVVAYINEKYGLIVGRNNDIYSSRMTTLDEQNLFRLPTDVPVLTLQRASYTRDRKTLILYSDMILLGSWFVHQHEYDVPIWGE